MRWCIGASRKASPRGRSHLVGYGDEEESETAAWRRRGRRGMNRFAELLDRLAYEPGRNNKLRLIEAYFREAGDPDRGYALAAHHRRAVVQARQARPDPRPDHRAHRSGAVRLSYDYVGDLSETVALIWPKAASPLAHNPPPPTLTEVVTTLRTLGKTRTAETACALARRARRDRPLGAAEARHRRACGSASRRGSPRPPPPRSATRTPHEIELIWPGLDAALCRAVRLAGGPRRQAGQSRSRAVPAR